MIFEFLLWKYFPEKQKSKDARKVPDKLSSPKGNIRAIVQQNTASTGIRIRRGK
jgi:hypothetical protein